MRLQSESMHPLAFVMLPRGTGLSIKQAIKSKRCKYLTKSGFPYIGRNRPFPSSPGPLFQSEGRCSAFDLEIISHANKTHFHKKGCAPSLILTVRVFGTRQWPILFILHKMLLFPSLTVKVVKEIF